MRWTKSTRHDYGVPHSHSLSLLRACVHKFCSWFAVQCIARTHTAQQILANKLCVKSVKRRLLHFTSLGTVSRRVNHFVCCGWLVLHQFEFNFYWFNTQKVEKYLISIATRLANAKWLTFGWEIENGRLNIQYSWTNCVVRVRLPHINSWG